MSILFLPGLPRLNSLLHVLTGLLRERHPRLARHLASHAVHPSMWATQWLMTVFAYSFPLHTTARIWDAFLHEGWKVPLRCVLALLAEHEKELLAAPGFENILLIFKRIPSSRLAREPWALLRAAFAIKFLSWASCAKLLAEEAWLREQGREKEVAEESAGTIFPSIPGKDRERLLSALPVAPGVEEEEEEGEEDWEGEGSEGGGGEAQQQGAAGRGEP